MNSYYQDDTITIYQSDCLDILPLLPNNSIDLIATDPPYGINFMGKDWDKALPDKKIWTECLRVLKDGAFAFVMSIPRADCLSRMIISLEDAGFLVNFTPIFWAYASGFPKAQNIGKAVDKRLGVKREIVGQRPIAYPDSECWGIPNKNSSGENPDPTSYKIPTEKNGGNYGGMRNITEPATPQAKALDGSYGGFQPKPAVEIVIVAMKPLSEKTFVDQALKNKKGITWLDEGRIPYDRNDEPSYGAIGGGGFAGKINRLEDFAGHSNQPVGNSSGRFPANLLVSDDVLNDGERQRGSRSNVSYGATKIYGHELAKDIDRRGKWKEYIGSFSRYFDLDKWFEERIKQLPASVQKTFPFLIVPKASKSEKNRYLENRPELSLRPSGVAFNEETSVHYEKSKGNYHPTVKPLKLISYLITLGSREGDIILDPFIGSGTTALASILLGRKCIGIEIKEQYCEIAVKRCSQLVMKYN